MQKEGHVSRHSSCSLSLSAPVGQQSPVYYKLLEGREALIHLCSSPGLTQSPHLTSTANLINTENFPLSLPGPRSLLSLSDPSFY